MHCGNGTVLEQIMSTKLDKEIVFLQSSFSRQFKKVKVSSDQEMAKADRNSYTKNPGGENLNRT